MRFTAPDARPSLTPLGSRLLHLSERKLGSLDGISYDEGLALRKGVLVRAAVRSAWQSVQDVSLSEVDDWSVLDGAMGDEDDEADMGEERWFEDMVSSMGEDDHTVESVVEHEWTESSVSMPEYELEYVEDMEAFTFPPSSPTFLPIDFSEYCHTDVDVVEVEDDADSEVDDDQYFVYCELPEWRKRENAFRYTSTMTPSVPTLPPVLSLSLAPPTPLSLPASISSHKVYMDRQSYYADVDEFIDDLTLPPPLIRSLSSSTVSSDDGEVLCKTPPMRGEELEFMDDEEQLDVKGTDLLMGLGFAMGQLRFGNH